MCVIYSLGAGFGVVVFFWLDMGFRFWMDSGQVSDWGSCYGLDTSSFPLGKTDSPLWGVGGVDYNHAPLRGQG